MSAPELPGDVLSRVGGMLLRALSPESAADERRRAWDQLQSLPDETLRQLDLNEDWRFIVGMLADNPQDDASGAEPWLESPGQADAWRGAEALPPASGPVLYAPAPAPVLDLYAQDLRWLVGDDFRRTPLLVPRPGDADAGPLARIELGASATEGTIEPSDEMVRRLAWSLTNHASALVTLQELWPERTTLPSVFLEESLGRRADRGVPPRLAKQLEGVLAENAGGREWFSELALWIDEFVDAEILEFLSVEQLADCHLALRLEVARRVRLAEITDAGLIAGSELFATVRLLRAASTKDLLRAWHAGGGQVERTVRHYTALHRTNDLFFDRAFRGVLRQPDAEAMRRLAPHERQAVSQTRGVRLRAGHTTSDFLEPGDFPL